MRRYSQIMTALKYSGGLPAAGGGGGVDPAALRKIARLDDFRGAKNLKLQLSAHRGFRYEAPQNTLMAMTNAALMGAAELECDGQVSSDGVIYLYHDGNASSLTTGTGVFTTLSSTQIDALRFQITAGGPLAEMRVPRFTDLLKLAKQLGLFTHVEIKGYRTIADVAIFVQNVVAAGMEDMIGLSSFYWDDIAAVRALNSRIQIGYLSTNPSNYTTIIPNLAALGNAMIMPDFNDLISTPAMISMARAADLDIVTWTVNTQEYIDKLMRLGVNRVMSDYLRAGT